MAMNTPYNKEIFDVEIEGWCYGLRNYPGEVYTELVSCVLDEVSPCFKAALEVGYAFNVLDIAEKFVEAGHYIVDHYTITKLICQKLPNPSKIEDEDELYVVANILDKIESQYVGIHVVMENFWNEQTSVAAA